MSQRDLVAELRAVRVAAPAEVRERVRLVAAQAPAPRTRFTWRRALVVALPVAAAIAASVVLTKPAKHEQALKDQPYATATVAQGRVVAAPPVPTAPNAGSVRELAVPSAPNRVQVYGATLGLRVRSVSDALKAALHVTSSLGGYPLSVHAGLTEADLTLKVPRVHVQGALARLSKLGTITAERIDVADRTAQLNATDREIARLRAQLRTAPPERAAGLIARIRSLQRAEAATRRTAHYATIHLHLATPHAAASHHHGPLHGVGVALRWLGIGAVYALAVGGPVVLLLALVLLALRLVRRRREEALLSSP